MAAIVVESPRALGAPARAEEMGRATSTSSGAASWRYVQGSSAQGENAQGEAGKSINAKALDGTAPEAMSTLLHAAYGLENYPNYLLKWDRAKVDGHVAALEAQLARARAARDALAARDAYVATYAPKHAYLRAPTAERALCASARAALAGRGDWAVRAELPGDVFSFPLLREDFCRDVAEECAHYLAFREAWVAARGGEAPPGTLRERLTVAEVGLGALEGFLLETLGPSHLFSLCFTAEAARVALARTGDASQLREAVQKMEAVLGPEHQETRKYGKALEEA